MPHSSSALASVAAAGMPLSPPSSPEEEGEEEGDPLITVPLQLPQHHRASMVSLSSTDGNEVEVEVEDEEDDEGEEEEEEEEEEVAAAAAAAAAEGITYATEDFPDSLYHKARGDGAEGESEKEEEEEDELRSSGDRPTLSTASTDDGVDDEERASRRASHILETVRALSSHSPSEWGRIVPSSSSSSLPFLSTGDAESASSAATADEATAAEAAPAPAGLPQLPYLQGRYAGMSLGKYASLGLRVQHPYAYYDPGNDNTFRVRGKHYLRDGRKYSAGPPVAKLVLACVFKIPPDYPGQREDHIASRGRMAEMLREMQDLDARDGRPPFLFLVNFQVPGDPPLSMVTVFALPRDRREEDGCFWTLFDRFLDFPMEEEEDGEGGRFSLGDFKNKRFKLIPSIAEGPSMIRWAVGNKPTILGQKLTQRYFRGENYVEVDVDIASSALASQIVSLCRGYAKYLKVEMGILLQGEEEAGELPEKLLGTIGITHLDINAYGKEEFLNVQVEGRE